jgi:hypothetical protein
MGGEITGIDLDVAALLAAIDARLAGNSDLASPVAIRWRTR